MSGLERGLSEAERPCGMRGTETKVEMTVARDGAIQVDDRDDDELDELDELDEDDEPDEPPAKQTRQAKPTYKQLLEEVTKLREGNTRNNRELATRRHLEGFMKEHKIKDLDAWLSSLGVDKTSAQLIKGTEDPSPNPTETPGTPAPGVDTTNTQQQPPVAPEAPTALSDAEVERRIQLEVEKRLARENSQKDETPPELTREEILADRLKSKEVDTILARLNFTGDRSKLMRVLDMSGIELDSSNEVVGADAAVQEIREEFPEWFRSRRPATVAPSRTGGDAVDGGDKRPPAQKPKSWADQVVDRWQSGK